MIDKGWAVWFFYHEEKEQDVFVVVNSIEGIPEPTYVLAGPFDTYEEAEKAGIELEQKYS